MGLEVQNFVTFPNSLWTFRKSKKNFLVFHSDSRWSRRCGHNVPPPYTQATSRSPTLHSGGNLGVRLGLELDKNIFKSIQKYFKSIQKYLTHTNSGLAHPKLFGSKYFWYVKYFYSYMSLFGQKLKFCFLCPMKTNFGKKWWKHKCLPNPSPYSQRPPLNTNRIPIWPNQACFPTV